MCVCVMLVLPRGAVYFVCSGNSISVYTVQCVADRDKTCEGVLVCYVCYGCFLRKILTAVLCCLSV